MRGNKKAARDLVQAQPDIILYCYEDLLGLREQEVELQQVYPSIPSYEIKSYQVKCGACNRTIEFFCRARPSAAVTLQTLLFDAVRLLCPSCVFRLAKQ